MKKEEKEWQRQKKIEETQYNLEQFIGKCIEHEKQYIALAAQAKAEKRMRDYQQTLQFLKAIIARKEQVKSMLHQFKLIKLAKDEAESSKMFMESMILISNETNKLYKNNDMSRQAKKLSQSMDKLHENQEMMNIFLESTQDTLNSFDQSTDVAQLDEELQLRINQEIEQIENQISASPEERLKDLKQMK